MIWKVLSVKYGKGMKGGKLKDTVMPCGPSGQTWRPDLPVLMRGLRTWVRKRQCDCLMSGVPGLGLGIFLSPETIRDAG